MAATTSLLASPKLPQRRITLDKGRNQLIAKRVTIKAQQGESNGKSIDDNMIVLRMRIKKMKVAEFTSGGGGEGEGEGEVVMAAPPSPTSEWMEWEKRVFTHYHEGVCDSVEMMQAFLLNMRPSVAVGVATLIAMSVPLSTSVVFTNALKLAKGLLAGCHVCIDIDF